MRSTTPGSAPSSTCEQALDDLDCLADSEAKSVLRTLAQYVMRRRPDCRQPAIGRVLRRGRRTPNCDSNTLDRPITVFRFRIESGR